MSNQTSLIPELDEVVAHGSAERRAETLRRITAFFLDGANRFNEDHVRLFDDVFGRLIAAIEPKARAELASRLAPVGNAPITVVRRLANDDDILIAGPVLSQSDRLDQSDLIEIARTKSQAHLLAISGRSGIAEPVTDVLVSRGDPAVVRKVVENPSSRLSEASFSKLLADTENDETLAEQVGLRPDLPPRLFDEILLKANDAMRQRMLSIARPETQAEIRNSLSKEDSAEVGAEPVPRDYSTAQRTVEGLQQAGRLDQTALTGFAREKQLEETVAALASLCAVPIAVVDRLMSGDRPDPVLILCKATGWDWPTAKAIISARRGGHHTSSQVLDGAYANFERLSPATAQRVMRFWQVQR